MIEIFTKRAFGFLSPATLEIFWIGGAQLRNFNQSRGLSVILIIATLAYSTAIQTTCRLKSESTAFSLYILQAQSSVRIFSLFAQISQSFSWICTNSKTQTSNMVRISEFFYWFVSNLIEIGCLYYKLGFWFVFFSGSSRRFSISILFWRWCCSWFARARSWRCSSRPSSSRKLGQSQFHGFSNYNYLL